MRRVLLKTASVISHRLIVNRALVYPAWLPVIYGGRSHPSGNIRFTNPHPPSTPPIHPKRQTEKGTEICPHRQTYTSLFRERGETERDTDIRDWEY